MKRHIGVALALLLGGCRAAPSSGSPAAQASGAPPVAAPPLDTSWERSPGRLLSDGEPAPDFQGIAHTGMRVQLSTLSTRPVVVYFYASDRSAEGEREARAFRGAWMHLREKIGMVVGVSPDDRMTHVDFATREDLPFLLVADDDGKIARAFGVTAGVSSAFVVGKDTKVMRVIASGQEPFATGVLRALETLGT